MRAVALVNAFLLLTGLTLLSSAGPDPLNRTSLVALTTVQARATGDFLDSIGVNTHMGYPATPYATNPSLIAQRLQELGIRHIRENLSFPVKPAEIASLHQLEAAGVEFDFIAPQPKENTTKDQTAITNFLATISQEFPNDTTAIEGPNEYDKSGSSTWAAALKAYQPRLYAGVRALASPSLSSLPVLAPSLGSANNSAQLKGLTGFTVGNVHPYPGGELPEGTPVVDRINATKTNVSGAAPIEASESGYHNGINAVVSSSVHRPVSEDVAGAYVPRLLLENFRLGLSRTYLYELVDAGTQPTPGVRQDDTALNDPEAHFGLVHFDLSYKPAGRALASLTTLLADPGPSVSLAGVPKITGTWGFDRQGLSRSRAGQPRLEPNPCRHTTLGVSLDGAGWMC